MPTTPSGGRARRRLTATVLVVVGAAFLLVGGVTLYARETLFDEHAFAQRATRTLQDEDVRKALDDQILDQVIADGGSELLSFRPALETVIHGVLDSDPFKQVFRKAAVHVHRVLFDRRRESIILDLADAGIAISGAAKAISPALAKHIPTDIKPGLIKLTKRDWATRTLDVADHVRFLGVLLPLLALVCFAAAILLAADRRLMFIRVGGALAVVAALTLIALFIGRSVLLSTLEHHTETVRHAVGASWDAFLDDLHTWALLVGGTGLIVAAAASSILHPVEGSPAGRLRALVTWAPASSGGRALRAIAVFVLSLLVILQPQWALEVAVITVGAYGVFFAVSEILRLIELGPAAVVGATGAGPPAPSYRRAALAAAAAPVAVVLLAIVVLTGDGDHAAARGDRNPKTCNGFAQLCDRPLNEVAFAATHNSMSAAKRRGWFFANQNGGIREQLEYGYRGLLIDTHYGYKTGGRVGAAGIIRTNILLEHKDRKELVAEIGKTAVSAAERLAGSLGFAGIQGQRGSYLCHALCELGDTTLVDGLKEIRQFLDRHPDELLIIFIEDKVSAADTAKAFEQSGLIRYVYHHPREAQWPTLRQLIRADRRAFVMWEAGPGGGINWYHDGFDFTQETPYSFKSQAQLASPASCRPNRGTPDSPLFQMNNWIDATPPPPGAGRKSNDYSTLLKRARMCQRIRGLLPNIIGVDFYDQGDPLGVVRTLNQLPRNARQALPTH
ncbi:MAG: hypothetical protein QOJ12_3024 [Thermoleophilales bacterium]|nr:hypothetical protein [Thermoleophilales bacterium]